MLVLLLMSPQRTMLFYCATIMSPNDLRSVIGDIVAPRRGEALPLCDRRFLLLSEMFSLNGGAPGRPESGPGTVD
jgi:hypothetical protein